MPEQRSEPAFARLALFPGLLGAIVLVAALALIGNADWYIWVRYIVAILALIMCVFAWQGKAYWWLIGLIPIAVVFNPVWPLTIGDIWLSLAHLAGAVIFIAAGIAIKVPTDDADKGPAGRYDGRGRPPAGRKGGQKRR
ncbi:DUF6804 family protein [Humibacter sp. RRB41]|uniref:DUF6804 family protein n=1 Tax=Humibacter sp. RRB41 TaxID=2919946 RepID=UPI001FAB0B15|nr:DUF6804 family protein [Humibacter sp. RRB41]